MLRIQINLRNPYSNRFENIRTWQGRTPFEHKFWELQLYKSSDLLEFTLEITHRQSHAGVLFGLSLLGFAVELNLYDSRHWNKDTKTWETY